MATLFMALLLTGGPGTRAEHFDIVMVLRGSKGVTEAHWDTSPPGGGVNTRPVLQAVAGEELRLEWRLRSEFPHGVMKRVTIRLFVAPVAGGKRIVDNSFLADFLPHHAARGTLRFRAPSAGSYQVRLQSEQTEKEHGHEHFSAIDLRVE